MVNDLSTLVQVPAQTGNKTLGSLIVSAVLLIESNHLISLMSIVKSSRTSEHGIVRDLVAQWLSVLVSDLIAPVRIPAQTGNNTGGVP